MTAAHVSITGNADGAANLSPSTQNDNITVSKSFTSGQVVLMGIWWRDSGTPAQTVLSASWNGQAFIQIGTNYDTGEGKFALYKLTASSTATSNVVVSLSGYVWLNSFIEVFNVSGSASFSVPVTQKYNSVGFAAPSLVVNSVPSTAVAISILAAMGWDKDYNDVSATVWTIGAGMTDRLNSKNDGAGSSPKSVTSLRVQTAAGAGSNVTAAWSNNANQPQYLHLALYVNDGLAYTLDTLTSPVRVGGTGYAGGTTNIGTVTSLSFAGEAASITGTSANAFTWSMPGFVNGVTYPAMGAQTFTASDGTNSGTKSSTVQTLAGYTDVTMATMNTGAWSLGKDPAIVAGVTIHAPTAAGTLNNDGTLTDYVFGTYLCWMRDLDGKMYSFNLIVSDSGVVTDGIPQQFRLLTRILPAMARR